MNQIFMKQTYFQDYIIDIVQVSDIPLSTVHEMYEYRKYLFLETSWTTSSRMHPNTILACLLYTSDAADE